MNKPQLPEGSDPSYPQIPKWKQMPLGLMGDYRVRFEVFEGPLDLLLHLVKKQEVDIYQVNLTQIAVDFVAYIDQMRRLDLEVAGEFLVMAATLLYIKSRELLPVEQQVVVQETEEEEIDPRKELIRRLVEYKKFKDAAAQLQVRETEMDGSYQRRPGPVDLEEPSPTRREPMSVFDLIGAVSTILKRFGDREDVGEIAADPYTVSQKIEYLRDYVRERSVCRFSELFEAAKSRVEVVVTFLALLELTRLRQVVLSQGGEFGEIEIATAPDPSLQPTPEAAEPQLSGVETLNDTAPRVQAELQLASSDASGDALSAESPVWAPSSTPTLEKEIESASELAAAASDVEPVQIVEIESTKFEVTAPSKLAPSPEMTVVPEAESASSLTVESETEVFEELPAAQAGIGSPLEMSPTDAGEPALEIYAEERVDGDMPDELAIADGEPHEINHPGESLEALESNVPLAEPPIEAGTDVEPATLAALADPGLAPQETDNSPDAAPPVASPPST